MRGHVENHFGSIDRCTTHARHYLTANTALLCQSSHTVAYGGWCVDLHAAHGLLDTHIMPSGDCRFYDGVYTIPYRCYYSKNISNLFMAGRNISATKLGMCSTRIIGCCVIGGQA
ncbi:MAG: FAD-dependent oxidoreductase, partial [Tidjanibacter sp.]|nr:FAD-dependent oxidoreductase [Tidjanibacter sp.]